MGRQLPSRSRCSRRRRTLRRRHPRPRRLIALLAPADGGRAASQMDVTAIAHAAIFALQAGLTELWRARGIEPDGVVGHSVGEVAAAYAAGVLSLEEATRVIFHRGRCMELASPHGQMLAVYGSRGPPPVAPFLESFGAAISLAAINSPTSVTLAGQPEPLQAVAAALEGRNVFCRFLRVNWPFHSAQMDPVVRSCAPRSPTWRRPPGSCRSARR
ncbi:MAG: acyltransferase domain-containing protein [Candidatus Binatia bacterium]